MSTTLKILKPAPIPTVPNSRGPDQHPFSQYATTNSVYHDLKLPMKEVAAKAKNTNSGFSTNNVPTRPVHMDDNAALRQISHSHSTFSASSSLYGVRADHAAEEEGVDIKAAVALARARRHGTGYNSNADAMFTSSASEDVGREPHLLAKAKMGNKAPISKENGWKGPAPMSTTYTACYKDHPMTNLENLENLEIGARRVPTNGAVSNMAATLLFVPHDGWNPTTEHHDKFCHPAKMPGSSLSNTGTVSILDRIPDPIPPTGLKKSPYPIIDRLRETIVSQLGAYGFRILDTNLTNPPSIVDETTRFPTSDLEKLFTEKMKLDLSGDPNLVPELSHLFDRDGKGTIGMLDFLRGARGSMSESRKKVVRDAFRNLEKAASQVLTMKVMADLFDPVYHPDVLKGLVTPDVIYNDFLMGWAYKESDSPLTYDEFVNYYEDLSAAIENDDYFELMVRNTWHVSGGCNLAANTSCRRVRVTHTSGNQTIEVLKNDLGIGPDDLDKMKYNLMAQGILDIQSIEPLDPVVNTQMGDLQRMVLRAKQFNALQRSRGAWEPFRNSSQSTENLLGNPLINPIEEVYPSRLTYLKEKDLKIKDPVEYSVYMNRNPYETTYGATLSRKPDKSVVTLQQLRSTQPEVQKLLNTLTSPSVKSSGSATSPLNTTKHALIKRMAGGNSQNSGYAANLQGAECNRPPISHNPKKLDYLQASRCRVSQRLDLEGDVRRSVYRSDFRDQWKVPLPAMFELRKNTSGFARSNMTNLFKTEKNPMLHGPMPGFKKIGVPIIDLIRQRLYERSGGGGFRGLSRAFRVMDTSGDRQIDLSELSAGLQRYGLVFTPTELLDILRYFDRDGSGAISVAEFLNGIRGPMSPNRLDLVDMAYHLIDINGDEQVTFDELLQLYDVTQHPEVLRKTKTPEQVMAEFVAGWDKNGDHTVTRDEFRDYYADISATIDDDDYFELMIRNAWHISGGSGYATNTSCRRVLVTHNDGSQTVEEIRNDLGIGPKDIEKMRANLASQGITDVQNIQLYE